MSEVTDIAIVGALFVGGYFLYKAYKGITGAFDTIGKVPGEIVGAVGNTTSAVIAPGGKVQTPNTITNNPLPDLFGAIFDYGFNQRQTAILERDQYWMPSRSEVLSTKKTAGHPFAGDVIQPW
jgi:hypothetical protein